MRHPGIKQYAACAVCMFPSLCATVDHAASTVFFGLAALGIYDSYRQRKNLSATERSFLLAFFAYFFLQAVTLVNTEQMSEGLKMLERLLRFPLVVFVYFSLKNTTDIFGKHLGTAFRVASCTLLTVALVQTFFLGHPRAEGAYNAIVFGGLGAWLASILYVRAVAAGKIDKASLLDFVCSGMALGACVLSFTRGAILVFPAMLLLCPALLRTSFALRITFASSMATALIILVVWQVTPEATKQRLASRWASPFQAENSSISTFEMMPRLAIWQDSFEMFKSSPILGVGLGDFRHELTRRIESGEAMTPKAFKHAHNVFIDSLARTGIYGFFIMLFTVFIVPAKLLLNSAKRASTGDDLWGTCGLVTLASFAVFGLTENWFSRMPLLTTFLISVAMFIALQQDQIEKGGQPHAGEV